MAHLVVMCLACKENRCGECENFGMCKTCNTVAACPCWEDSHRRTDFDSHVSEALAVVAES